MTRYLLATTSVHTTAAAADYLGPRLTDEDRVVVLTVAEPDLPERDAGDAANVARSRLLPATVTVTERAGDPAEQIKTAVTEERADVLLVGPRRGGSRADAAPGRADVGKTLGSTARSLLGTVDVPVVVVPA